MYLNWGSLGSSLVSEPGSSLVSELGISLVSELGSSLESEQGSSLVQKLAVHGSVNYQWSTSEKHVNLQ